MNLRTYRYSRGFSHTLRSMQTTTTTVPSEPKSAISMAEIIAKATDPVEAVRRLGEMIAKSQMLGPTERVEIGQVAVLLCATQGITVGDLLRTYTIQFGKLAKTIDAAVAEFMKAGGTIEWLEDGSNRTSAKARFTLNGESLEVGCTVEEAQKAGWTINKKWFSEPTAMLRARVKKNGVRALAPWIFAGEYESDDVPQVAIDPARAVAAMSEASTTAPVVGIDFAKAAAEAKAKESPAVAPRANGGPGAGSVAQGSATSTPQASAVAPATTTQAATSAEAPELSAELQTQLLGIIGEANIGHAQLWLTSVGWLPAGHSINQLPEKYARQIVGKASVFKTKLAEFIAKQGGVK